MLRDIGLFIQEMRSALSERLHPKPVDSVEALAEFCRTRSAYIAQTSLFGYLKTRMGTQFRDIFVDDTFSAVIRGASVRLMASCLSDLTIFAVATLHKSHALEAEAARALAVRCFDRALADGVPKGEFEDVSASAPKDFRKRVAKTDWTADAEGPAAFAGSEGDLIRFAPVVDEFKKDDAEIVSNSIRYRWRDVREQFRKRLDAEAVLNDWRGPAAAAPAGSDDVLPRDA